MLDKVKIKELNRTGRIISILITCGHIRYEVRYIDNARAESVYFFKDEIEIVV